MRRSKVWVPAGVLAVILGGLVVGSLVDAGERGPDSNLATRDSDTSPKRQRGQVVSLPGLGDYELPPFPELVRISEGVLEGTVTDISSPKWNLPEGEKFDWHKDYPWDPLSFTTVTVRVDRWLYNDGSFTGPEVILTVPGGIIKMVLTREELIDLLDLAHHPEVDPYEVAPGGRIYGGDEPYGGLTVSVGEKVALLVNRTTFSTPSGVTRVPQVTAYSAGKFLIGPNGELRNEVVSQPDAPRSVGELEDLVREVKG